MSTVNLISQQPPTPIATIPGLYTDNPFRAKRFLPNSATSKMSMAGTVHQKRVWNSVTVWNGPGIQVLDSEAAVEGQWRIRWGF